MSLRLPAVGLAALAAAGCAGSTVEPAGGNAAGAAAFAKCQSCHSLAPGENLPSGPTLDGIVGRAVAAQPGFDYSPALRRLALAEPRWTPALLDRMIADPEALAPGTYMAFQGLHDPAEREALIEWLKRR